ncbi:MAG: NADH-quinone oxidoreductase subunit K [Planctomycetaceae bacterium]
METLVALLIGALYAGGLYLVLRRSIVKLLIGLAILSHAANLLIFTSGGLTRGAPPLIAKASGQHASDEAEEPVIGPPHASADDAARPRAPQTEAAGVENIDRENASGEEAEPAKTADPLPQALILTAIVISFAVLAFSLVLMLRAYQAVGSDDLDRLNTTDQ